MNVLTCVVKYYIFHCLVLLSHAQLLTLSKNAIITNDCHKTTIFAQTGKIEINNFCTDYGIDREDIIIQIDSIAEFDAKGNQVGISGVLNHYVSTFALEEFTFNSTLVTENVGTAKAKGLTMAASLKEMGTIEMKLHFITQQGRYEAERNNDTTLYTLEVGNFKLSMILRDWVFCDAQSKVDMLSYCEGDADGAYVDVNLSVINVVKNNSTILSDRAITDQVPNGRSKLISVHGGRIIAKDNNSTQLVPLRFTNSEPRWHDAFLVGFTGLKSFVETVHAKAVATEKVPRRNNTNLKQNALDINAANPTTFQYIAASLLIITLWVAVV